MTLFYRTVLYTFIVLLSVVYRLTNAAHDSESLSTEEVDLYEFTDSTSILPVVSSTVNSSTTSVLNILTTISVTMSTAASDSTSSSDSMTTAEINTSTIDSNRPPDVPSGPGWWLLIALLITIVIVIIGGVIFYYRQHSPYRRSTSCIQWCRQCNFRFLRSWRSHDDDTDNIILQLEQPEVTNGQWPPRISFT